MANLADQLDWCIDSIDYLKKLSDAINIAEKNVNDSIDVLHQSTFSEYTNLLLPLQEQYKNKSLETQKFINEYHIQYLNNRIKSISGTLDTILKK